MRGISPERWEGCGGEPGAADLIRQALATGGDHEALATMAIRVGGIYHFGPAMSSSRVSARHSAIACSSSVIRPTIGLAAIDSLLA